MATYIIHELQNLNSVRQGYEFTGSLTAAKRAASRNQAFCGTVLTIRYPNGETAATKDLHTGKWYQPLDA
jgi:hypothetical protein